MNVIPGNVALHARRPRAARRPARARPSPTSRRRSRRSARAATSRVDHARDARRRRPPPAPPGCRTRSAQAIAAEGLAGAPPAVRRGPRRHGDRRPRRHRHAVRPLQGRHQPQSAGSDHGRGRASSRRACSCASSSISRPAGAEAPRSAMTGAARLTPRDRGTTSPAQRDHADAIPRGAGARCPPTIRPGDCAPHAERAAALLEGLGFAVERHPVPADVVRANGMVSATNLVVRVRFGDRARRSRSTRTATSCRRGSAGPRIRTAPRSRTASCTAAASRCRSPISRPTRSRCCALKASGARARRHASSCTSPTTRKSGGSIGPALAARAGHLRGRISRSPPASPTASPRRTTAACTSKSRSSASRRTRRDPRRASTRSKRRPACWRTSTRSARRTRRRNRRSPASTRRRSSSA